jgi:hypothetical protein
VCIPTSGFTQPVRGRVRGHPPACQSVSHSHTIPCTCTFKQAEHYVMCTQSHPQDSPRVHTQLGTSVCKGAHAIARAHRLAHTAPTPPQIHRDTQPQPGCMHTYAVTRAHSCRPVQITWAPSGGASTCPLVMWLARSLRKRLTGGRLRVAHGFSPAWAGSITGDLQAGRALWWQERVTQEAAHLGMAKKQKRENKGWRDTI